MLKAKVILPIIVIAQFFCTSIWFAGNAVITTILPHANSTSISNVLSAVQFGFITGTLIFAFLSLSDRFSPSKIFFTSAIIAAIFNIGVVYAKGDLTTILLLRFASGFFLAGIYPIGMKIVADYYKDGLGSALGYLVGALVLGTALPHLLKGISFNLSYQSILQITSALALTGGVLVGFLVPNGPFRVKSNFDASALLKIFKHAEFKAVAIGYFGHCWELYAFWAFVPQLLLQYNRINATVAINSSLMAFIIIASGSLACIISGYFSKKIGVKRLATIILLLSCLCCLLSPLLFYIASIWLVFVILVVWGMLVVADSPLFSTLMAQHAPVALKGTALTIANCIGFSVTIISIQCIGLLIEHINPSFAYVFLAFGPIVGLISLAKKRQIE
ncbi:MFS transporter [Pedobacter cryotolerans]|uniref:MFS transporter n=1 Tax=Pedobacter cryotolerans TaxID=2571270 RepID=A0A4U1C7S0_9SPHI|nr:MFS transporter [Pedobacter cryotolerans]TKC01437.1 MFS transporter [Pedobacter cryotolerans]